MNREEGSMLRCRRGREGRRPPLWCRSPPGSLNPAGSDGFRFAAVRDDLGLDFSRCQCIEPAPLGATPRFLEPVGWRRHSADEILHAHDDDGRLAAAIDDEALVVLVARSMICPNWVRAMCASMRSPC